MSAAVSIIGLGTGTDLTADATARLDAARLLVGGARQLSLVDHLALQAERWDLTGRLKEAAPTIAAAVQRGPVVVLASGDPLFFGIGSYLIGKLQALELEVRVLPAPSSVSVAAARFGLSWHDARVVSGHGRPLGDIAGMLRRHGKVAVLTDQRNTPAAIGGQLRDAGVVDGMAHVAEALGSEHERCRSLPLADLHTLVDTDPLNVVLLVAPCQHTPAVPYTADTEFDKKMPQRGLITKREIRVLSLAALGVGPGDTCWDLGAGSGAVSIDMARCGASAVWAVEKNADGCEIIAGNIARFGTRQVQVVHAKAPDGLDRLPDPDRVFIGGSGGQLRALIERSLARLRPGGSVVINAATVENLAEALATLRATGAPFEATQVQVARSRTILGRLTRFDAHNPVTIVRAARPGEAL